MTQWFLSSNYFSSKYLCEMKNGLKISFELKFWSNVFDDVRFMVWMGNCLIGANLSNGKKTSLSVACNNALFQAKFNVLRYWSWSWRHFMHLLTSRTRYCQAPYLIKQQKLTYMYYVIYWHNIRYFSFSPVKRGVL